MAFVILESTRHIVPCDRDAIITLRGFRFNSLQRPAFITELVNFYLREYIEFYTRKKQDVIILMRSISYFSLVSLCVIKRFRCLYTNLSRA